jgi:hypothetical protein
MLAACGCKAPHRDASQAAQLNPGEPGGAGDADGKGGNPGSWADRLQGRRRGKVEKVGGVPTKLVAALPSSADSAAPRRPSNMTIDREASVTTPLHSRETSRDDVLGGSAPPDAAAAKRAAVLAASKAKARARVAAHSGGSGGAGPAALAKVAAVDAGFAAPARTPKSRPAGRQRGSVGGGGDGATIGGDDGGEGSGEEVEPPSVVSLPEALKAVDLERFLPALALAEHAGGLRPEALANARAATDADVRSLAASLGLKELHVRKLRSFLHEQAEPPSPSARAARASQEEKEEKEWCELPGKSSRKDGELTTTTAASRPSSFALDDSAGAAAAADKATGTHI